MKLGSNKLIENKKLKEIRNSCNYDGWDLYNASKIRVHDIIVAKKILNNFFITPEAFPTGSGTIQFEFECEDIYLEFELKRISKKEYKLEWFRMRENDKYLSSNDCGVISSRDYKRMNEIVVETFSHICF